MKGSRLRDACESSVILGFFRRIVSGFYDLLLYGVFRRARKRYPDAVKAVDGSAAAELFDLSSARNRALSRKLYKSPLSAVAKALKRRLLSTTMRSYGTLFVLFGLFSSVYYALPLFRFAEILTLDTVSLGISLGVFPACAAFVAPCGILGGGNIEQFTACIAGYLLKQLWRKNILCIFVRHNKLRPFLSVRTASVRMIRHITQIPTRTVNSQMCKYGPRSVNIRSAA